MTILKGPKNGKLELATRSQPKKNFKVPPRPAELPAEMQREWARICKNLESEKLWHDDRTPIVSAYLHAVWTYRQACAAIDAHGAFDVENGKPHPALMASQKASNHAAVLAKALGLTVSASMIEAKGGEKPAPTATQGAWARTAGK